MAFDDKAEMEALGYRSFPDQFKTNNPSYLVSWQKAVYKDGVKAYFVNVHFHTHPMDPKVCVSADTQMVDASEQIFNVEPFAVGEGVDAIRSIEAFFERTWTALKCLKYDRDDD
jgi:hypothetical protein